MSDYENKIPLEVFMARYFVKYNRLDKLIQYAFAGSKATSIDLFIDIYGIYRSIFSRSFVTNVSDYTSFTSTLVNMCGHYRAYFKMLGVSTKIFLISGFNVPENSCKFVAGYNKTFQDKLRNKMIYDMVEQNIQLLELLCKYLPDIFFVKTDFETSVAIHNIIKKEKNSGRDVPSIVISSDTYPIQLTTLWNDVAYIKSKKSNGEDISDIVCPFGHPEHELSFWSIICQEKEDFSLNQNIVTITSRNYVLLSALNKFFDRNLKAIVNFNTANKIISSIDGCLNVKLNVDNMVMAIPDIVDRVPIQIIDSRYKVMDIEYQDILYNESVEPMLLSFENLSDMQAIQIINDQYFSNNPIDIFKL